MNSIDQLMGTSPTPAGASGSGVGDQLLLGLTDIDGLIRGKYVKRAKAEKSVAADMLVTAAWFGWDITDDPYGARTRLGGFHAGANDIPVRLQPDTLRPLPPALGGGEIALLQCVGEEADVCPRSLLQRQLDKARALGIEILIGVELEFWLTHETPDSLVGKPFGDCRFPVRNGLSCSVDDTLQLQSLFADIAYACDLLNVPLETTHVEGPGMFEAAFSPMPALAAADGAVLFKAYMRALANRRGLLASFMPKPWANIDGAGLHIHLSARDANGKPLFADNGAADGMSLLMRQFLAGAEASLRDFSAVFAPTVNSYKRYLNGLNWLPQGPSWGHDNRSCALRVVGEQANLRFEHRMAGADANPYLVIAAIVAGGIDGVTRGVEPTAPRVGKVDWAGSPPADRMPHDLLTAAQLLAGSSTARRLLGDTFVDHFAATRTIEAEKYLMAVSDWELRRYFERI